MSDTPFQMTREDLDALVLKFREVKHTINNHIAVIMALSELSQQNTAHVEKLIKATLARSPEIVGLLQTFQKELGAKLTENGATVTRPPGV
jgi:two-component sensor histidine kinase